MRDSMFLLWAILIILALVCLHSDDDDLMCIETRMLDEGNTECVLYRRINI